MCKPLPTDAQLFHPDLRRAINHLQIWCAPDERHLNRSNSTAYFGDWAIDATKLTGKGEERVARLGHLVDMHDLHQLQRFTEYESEADAGFLGRVDPEVEVS